MLVWGACGGVLMWLFCGVPGRDGAGSSYNVVVQGRQYPRQSESRRGRGASRAAVLSRLQQAAVEGVDVVVAGGGATGLGVALDAAQRGLRTVLLEAADFAAGTSSRATKLLHGGVRYLERGDVALVREALRERATVIRNAPHVAQRMAFVVPAATRWQRLKYGAGLRVYEWLAGERSLGRTRLFSAAAAAREYAGLQRQCVQYGAVQYWDAQFDDARLALELALKACELGAVVVNHCAVTELLLESGRVAGVRVRDAVQGGEYVLRAGCVINAAGVWADGLRRQAAAAAVDGRCAGAADGITADGAADIVQPSQGAHVVLPQRFWPYAEALLVPKTADGRVLFAVPWLGSVVVGTTDTPVQSAVAEPVPFAQEVDFILDEAGRYLREQPVRGDVLSAWAGLRPLVRAQGGGSGQGSAAATAAVSREHVVEVAASGLVTVVGGKWTTYRSMADDTLRQCVRAGLLPQAVAGCGTEALALGVLPEKMEQMEQMEGAETAEDAEDAETAQGGGGHYGYGGRYADVLRLPGAAHWLVPARHGGDGCALSEAMVRHAVRFEMACTVQDVLARRRRVLFLDAGRAVAVAPQVAEIMRAEGVQQPALEDFLRVAAGYRLAGVQSEVSEVSGT